MVDMLTLLAHLLQHQVLQITPLTLPILVTVQIETLGYVKMLRLMHLVTLTSLTEMVVADGTLLILIQH